MKLDLGEGRHIYMGRSTKRWRTR